jgi:nitrite reductase/ring-hydroxylating ferredoxin subunit
MREFEVKGCDLAVSGTVLVVRDGDTFHAVGNKCTHFGAPLAKGSYCGGRVRCPWHGASFDVRTGDIEDYPGFDSLTKFTVSNGASLVGHLQTRVANNQVMLSIEQDSFVGNGCREKPLPLVLPVGEASLGAQQPVVVIVGGGRWLCARWCTIGWCRR